VNEGSNETDTTNLRPQTPRMVMFDIAVSTSSIFLYWSNNEPCLERGGRVHSSLWEEAELRTEAEAEVPGSGKHSVNRGIIERT
jgi:hypothetical protein